MNAPTYSATGQKSTSGTVLAKDIFGQEINDHQLLKDAYCSYLANGRENLAVVKTRGLVSGGGKKPWRQKGTGRARFGSSRNPIWRGGGIAFGPTGNENYAKKLNIKAKRIALKQALTLAQSTGKISVIEDIKLKNAKTAELVALINKLSVEGSLLLVLDKLSNELKLSARNIPFVLLSTAKGLNVFDVLNSDRIVITKPALKEIELRLEAK
jgi:large subunit ribosomal protein L4